MRLPPEPSPPAFWHVPEGSIFTIADEVLDLMPELGYEVAEPERLAVRALLPQRPDGSWAGLQSCIIAARQNIKTASMIACAIHDTFIQDLDVVWTAHEFKTSADAFKDFQAIIEANDELASQVLRIRTANGNEGFDLRSGASLRIIARSGRSGRGFSKVPRLYADEGLFLDAKMLGAITPTMGAVPNAHMVIGSSPGILASTQLRELRERGRSGTDQDLGYVEWTSDRLECAKPDCRHAPETPGCQLDNVLLWWQANPALGRRIDVDFLRNQRKVLQGAIPEFMREHMGWWEDPPVAEESSLFPMEQWAQRFDSASTVAEGAPIAFAVDTSWDRQRSWVSVAGLNAQGVPHVEIVETGFGQDWVVPWLTSRVDERKPLAIGLQGGNAPVSTLADKLEKQFGGLVHVMTGIDCARACGRFFDAVEKGPLAHIGQEQLEDAMMRGVARPMGEGWVLDRKLSPVDVSGLFSAIKALYLLLTTEPAAPKQVSVPKRLR